jgi:hypothetical protein
MSKNAYRQGDVLIAKITKLPKNLTPVKAKNGRYIVAEGEVTGHAHAITEEMAEMFVDDKGVLYLSTKDGAVLSHEEHSAIELPKGFYTYTPQLQYTPEDIRNVRD